ncbi:hypothetical protein PHBOTO_004219 [Pseudozyma hubeiensis]|nr:hypothetical protein PHBOTO_004219 [Pseudozyma hubeiensis]
MTSTALTSALRSDFTSLQTRWLASPHLSMLSHPLRKCIVTSKILPTSLMFALKPITLPPSPASKGQDRIVMLPDSILHPAKARRKTGKGVWVTLDPRVCKRLVEKGAWKAVYSKAMVGKGMEELVRWQLGERVVQELEVLVERFGERRRLDLIAEEDGSWTEESGWAIHIQQHGGETKRSSKLQTFTPQFQDTAQAEKFHNTLRKLIPSPQHSNQATGPSSVYRVKQSHITAPLGVALYRLNMWTKAGSVHDSPNVTQTGRSTSHKQSIDKS